MVEKSLEGQVFEAFKAIILAFVVAIVLGILYGAVILMMTSPNGTYTLFSAVYVGLGFAISYLVVRFTNINKVAGMMIVIFAVLYCVVIAESLSEFAFANGMTNMFTFIKLFGFMNTLFYGPYTYIFVTIKFFEPMKLMELLFPFVGVFSGAIYTYKGLESKEIYAKLLNSIEKTSEESPYVNVEAIDNVEIKENVEINENVVSDQEDIDESI